MVFIRKIRYTNTEERTALFKVPSRTDFQAALRIVPNRNKRTNAARRERERTRTRTTKTAMPAESWLTRSLVCTKNEANAIVTEATVGGSCLQNNNILVRFSRLYFYKLYL